MKLSDDAKKAARLAAQQMKEALDVKTLPATPESTREMETGSPRTPGYDEHQLGRAVKPPPQWPPAKEVEPVQTVQQEHDRDAATDNDIDR